MADRQVERRGKEQPARKEAVPRPQKRSVPYCGPGQCPRLQHRRAGHREERGDQKQHQTRATGRPPWSWSASAGSCGRRDASSRPRRAADRTPRPASAEPDRGTGWARSRTGKAPRPTHEAARRCASSRKTSMARAPAEIRKKDHAHEPAGQEGPHDLEERRALGRLLGVHEGVARPELPGDHAALYRSATSRTVTRFPKTSGLPSRSPCAAHEKRASMSHAPRAGRSRRAPRACSSSPHPRAGVRWRYSRSSLCSWLPTTRSPTLVTSRGGLLCGGAV